MSTAVARNLMAEMKLLGMFESFDRLLTEATRDQWSCAAFFDAVLQAESDYRTERKTKRRIKAAKFAIRPTFQDFDFTANRSISRAQIKDLYSMQWLTDSRPVLLIGQTGVGKTFIAQALGLQACASGKSVLYMPVTEISWSRQTRQHSRPPIDRILHNIYYAKYRATTRSHTGCPRRRCWLTAH